VAALQIGGNIGKKRDFSTALCTPWFRKITKKE
jgi:hypothetical protein